MLLCTSSCGRGAPAGWGGDAHLGRGGQLGVHRRGRPRAGRELFSWAMLPIPARTLATVSASLAASGALENEMVSRLLAVFHLQSGAPPGAPGALSGRTSRLQRWLRFGPLGVQPIDFQTSCGVRRCGDSTPRRPHRSHSVQRPGMGSPVSKAVGGRARPAALREGRAHLSAAGHGEGSSGARLLPGPGTRPPRSSPAQGLPPWSRPGEPRGRAVCPVL